MREIHDLFQFRSGIEMVDYAQDLSKDRDAHRQIYPEIFRQQYRGQLLLPHQFNRFAKAMEELSQDYPRNQSVGQGTRQKSSDERSSTRLIL